MLGVSVVAAEKQGRGQTNVLNKKENGVEGNSKILPREGRRNPSNRGKRSEGNINSKTTEVV